MTVIYEKYPATVTNNDDPDQRGLIRVSCVGIMGDEDSELPMQVQPVLDWGWFYIPDVGEQIEIEVIVGSTEDEQFGQSSIDQLSPRWRGRRFYGNEEGGAGAQATPIHPDFKINYGKRRGFATPLGHILMFDDTEADPKVTLTWTDGAKTSPKFSFLSFDGKGSITLGTHNGHMLFMNAEKDELTLVDKFGNLYSSDKDGSKLVNKDGTLVDMNGPNVQILAANAVTISCKDATLDASKVNLGGQPLTEAILKGIAMVAALSAHTHIGGAGPTSPPIPSDIVAFTAALSAFVFTK